MSFGSNETGSASAPPSSIHKLAATMGCRVRGRPRSCAPRRPRTLNATTSSQRIQHALAPHELKRGLAHAWRGLADSGREKWGREALVGREGRGRVVLPCHVRLIKSLVGSGESQCRNPRPRCWRHPPCHKVPRASHLPHFQAQGRRRARRRRAGWNQPQTQPRRADGRKKFDGLEVRPARRRARYGLAATAQPP